MTTKPEMEEIVEKIMKAHERTLPKDLRIVVMLFNGHDVVGTANNIPPAELRRIFQIALNGHMEIDTSHIVDMPGDPLSIGDGQKTPRRSRPKLSSGKG